MWSNVCLTCILATDAKLVIEIICFASLATSLVADQNGLVDELLDVHFTLVLRWWIVHIDVSRSTVAFQMVHFVWIWSLGWSVLRFSIFFSVYTLFVNELVTGYLFRLSLGRDSILLLAWSVSMSLIGMLTASSREVTVNSIGLGVHNLAALNFLQFVL